MSFWTTYLDGPARAQVVAGLTAARAEVAKGWCQRALEDEHGNVCALGALNRVTSGDARCDQEMPEGLYGVLWDHVPDHQSVASYNNAETTTQQDVLNLFDKALSDLGGLG